MQPNVCVIKNCLIKQLIYSTTTQCMFSKQQKSNMFSKYWCTVFLRKKEKINKTNNFHYSKLKMTAHPFIVFLHKCACLFNLGYKSGAY